uniref:Interferon alpha-inducible protein 27-like protein 2B isoform X2 n=1 Tax=Crassostrea virginica TaxID=6565 RepID=A0A8B8BS99_CRAVI|nr:interferon alpha-inducible protein 27-like protein 2B isoform X2 [Crassostrea virginica]
MRGYDFTYLGELPYIRTAMPEKKVIAAVGAGAAAVVAAPAVLAGAGFTSAGVAAGSVAAMIQTPATAAGTWFALSQSAGVLGMAATTKAAVGAVAGGITYVASLFV